MSRSTWILARSLLFNTLFYVNLLVHMIVALPTLVLPYRVLRVFIRSYARTSLWLLRVICGTKVSWCGTQNIPRGSCIVACKHQSAWETFALYAVLEDPIYILKRELMWIPLFGWYTWKAGLIPIDRSAGMAALARMTARAQRALNGPYPRQLVIFPEGTRRTPGAAPSYKPGIVHLYARTRLPCVPAAPAAGYDRHRISQSDRAGTRQGRILHCSARRNRTGKRALDSGIRSQASGIRRSGIRRSGIRRSGIKHQGLELPVH